MPIPDPSKEQYDACAASVRVALERIYAATMLPTAERRSDHIGSALEWFENQADAFHDEDRWVYERWRFTLVMAMCELMSRDAEAMLTTAPGDDGFFSLEARNPGTGEPVDLANAHHGDPAAEGQAVAFQIATVALNGQLDTCASLWQALEARQDEGFADRSGYAVLRLSYLAARVRLKVLYRQGVLPDRLKQALELVMAQEPYGDLGL